MIEYSGGLLPFMKEGQRLWKQ